MQISSVDEIDNNTKTETMTKKMKNLNNIKKYI